MSNDTARKAALLDAFLTVFPSGVTISASIRTSSNVKRPAVGMHVLALQRWCEAALPSCVIWHSERFEPLLASSRSAARQKRRREFDAGRDCASSCLQKFHVNKEVGVAKDRSPIWPDSFVGSISHSDLTVWAAVSKQKDLLSIGIDTETIDRAAKVDIRSSIASEHEWAIAENLGFDEETTISLVFSAKESFYKCWFPITNHYFDFEDALVVDANCDSVAIAFAPSNLNLGQQPESLHVRYLIRAGEVFTATWISQWGASE